MGKSAPKAPDPGVTAAEQGKWNSFTAQQQQLFNMVGQNSPYGSLEYNQSGSTWITDPNGNRVEVPTYTATTTLSPEQQEIFNRNQQAQKNLSQIAVDQSSRVGDILNNPFEFNNQDAEKWAWDLASPRILQQQQQNETALRTRLINQGIRPGTPAWDREMTRLTNSNTDQLNQLALTGRNQAFSESLATRSQPLNEIIGLMSGTQIQAPNSSFAQTPQASVGGVDYTSLVNQKYQSDLANYNSGMNALGGLFGLGGKMIAMSDRRAKRDIRRIGTLKNGLPWYRFNYIWDREDERPREGLMSDDVRVLVPGAIVVDPVSGFDMVDYSMAMES